MIAVENLRKHFGDTVAVDGISFEIKKGEIVGFLGPNGAGKTTTMRILTGFLQPTSGEVALNGHDVGLDPLGVRRSIGYLPESAPLYSDMKVWEYLVFIARAHGVASTKINARVREVAKMCGLSDRLGFDIGHLSKGYRQRVGLAQAMVHDPDILILDEPTSGLDPNQIVEIRGLIKDIGKHKTVILSTHILPEAEATCDRVLIINKGKIVASGTMNELRGRNAAVQLLRVTVEGNTAGVVDGLRGRPSVKHVLVSDGAEKGTTTFEIEIEGEADMRKEITSLLVSKGLALLEVKREGKTLEGIFADLTQGS